jgi:hypothetical protein
MAEVVAAVIPTSPALEESGGLLSGALAEVVAEAA